MSARGWTFAVVLAVAARAGAGEPAVVETRAAVHLKRAASAHAKPVAAVKGGQRGRVLARKGAWVRVEIDGRAGWLPEKQVRAVAAEAAPAVVESSPAAPVQARHDAKPAGPVQARHEAAPAAPLAAPVPHHEAPAAPLARSIPRRESWVSASKFHEADQVETVVVRKKAQLHGHPDPQSAVVGVAREGERLHRMRVSTDGRWSMVEAGAGEVAWLESGAVQPLSGDADAPVPGAGSLSESRMTPASVAASNRAASAPATGDAVEVVARLPAPAPSGLALGVAGGLAIESQRYVSDGKSELSSYQYSVDSAVVRVSLAYRGTFARRMFWSLDGSYAFAGGGSIRYPVGNPGPTQVAIQAHDGDAGAQLGVHLDALGGLDLRLRAGGRMTAHIVEVKPSLQLPSDRLLGATVGLGVDAPQLSMVGSVPVGLHLYGEALLHGSLAMGQGLSLGSSSGTWGGRFGGALTFGVVSSRRNSLTIALGYVYQIDLTHFTGTSYLDASITTADLGSAVHVVTAGLEYAY